MRAFDVPAMQPSRTRGRPVDTRLQPQRNPYMVRFGAGGAGDADDQTRLIPDATQDRVEKFNFKAARLGRKKPATIWCCDCISAWISLLALIVGIIFSSLNSGGKLWDLKFELWDQNVLVSNDTAFNHSFNNWTHGVQEFCPKNEKRHVHEIRAYWNASDYRGTAIIEAASMDGAFGYAFAWFMPWIVLFIIFIFSICFQCGRLQVNDNNKIDNNKPEWWDKGTWSYTSSYCGNYWQSPFFLFYWILFILSIPGKLFSMIFKGIQSGQSACEKLYQSDGVFNRFVKYRTYCADKPELWRWVEYALTAPLQILLIAYSVFIGDRATLFNLMGLQGAMVLVGYINEKHIDKIWKRAINQRTTGTSFKWGYEWYKLTLLMTFSWLFFLAIWWTILTRFARQVDNQSDCQFIDKMPTEVNFILWTQSLLFASFGIVQTLQVDHMRQNINRISKDDDVTNAAEIENIRANSWHTVTLWYSILSVTAKTILEGGFIALVWAQGETRR